MTHLKANDVPPYVEPRHGEAAYPAFDLGTPSKTFDDFTLAVEATIDAFSQNALFDLMTRGSLKLQHYHNLLLTIFHQTYSSPYTFARAGVNCSWRNEEVKEYLIRHAEEERTHWRWVLDDLLATNYSGPSPRGQIPPAAALAYVGLNYIAAEDFPESRLAIASVLEGIGARYGGEYGAKMLAALELRNSQASFFLSHGETDKTHSSELLSVLSRCQLSNKEWGIMTGIAQRAGELYRAMYDYSAAQDHGY